MYGICHLSPICAPPPPPPGDPRLRACVKCSAALRGRKLPRPLQHRLYWYWYWYLFLDKEDQVQIWKALLDSSWLFEWNPPGPSSLS